MTLPLNEFRARLEGFLADKLAAAVVVREPRQITGGASRSTWAVDADVTAGPDAGLQRLIVRQDMGGEIQPNALSREQEFRVLQAAHAAGVLVPRPRWLCVDAAVLGSPFFIMDRLDGESVGRRIVREPSLAAGRKLLPSQMGQQLAKIHAIDPDAAGLDFLPRPEPGQSPGLSALETTARQLRELNEPHPALDLAYRWLRNRAPSCDRLVLCHGDFRIGNVMVGPDGLRGVFDWEFSHIGDPAADLAWPTVRSWRFGQDHLPFGGLGEVEPFLTAYREAGGADVDPAALHFWQILGNFRWAVGCMGQAHRHLSGQAPNLELASLGRRSAEMELELLDLIERHG